ncbi:Uncharacterised protein [Streptococcus pneumoniae]|nr:Uncharacterised protein [Streptococcus pneumoniae]
MQELIEWLETKEKLTPIIHPKSKNHPESLP